MAIRTFDELMARASLGTPITVAVAAAEDETVLSALAQAQALGLAQAILVGDRERICALSERVGLSPLGIIPSPDPSHSAQLAAELVGRGEARCLMKGLVGTAEFLRGILAPDSKMTAGGLLSHVGVLASPLIDRLILSTDGAVNISPSLEEKAQLIRNVLVVTRALNIRRPRIAVLAAIEKVYAKMVSTTDAAALAVMGRDGLFGEAIVDGPLGFDNAVTHRAAEHKRIVSDVAGRADALICPDIESAIMAVKSAVYLGGVKNAGVVIGARAPVILTSRSDASETKLVSIALACLLSESSRSQEPTEKSPAVSPN